MGRWVGAMLAVVAVVGLAGPAAAVEVQRSADVQASPGEVWEVVGDFCSIADWHPVIETCLIEEAGGVTYRILETDDGGLLREQLIELDDQRLFYTYSILESPLPVQGYRATVSVLEGPEEDTATVVWRSEFIPEGMAESEAAAIMAGIYDAGLEAIQERFAR